MIQVHNECILSTHIDRSYRENPDQSVHFFSSFLSSSPFNQIAAGPMIDRWCAGRVMEGVAEVTRLVVSEGSCPIYLFAQDDKTEDVSMVCQCPVSIHQSSPWPPSYPPPVSGSSLLPVLSSRHREGTDADNLTCDTWQ